ncbi:Integrase/recombinase [Halomicronema hongdechloris C2206]|uniref:Integrase/recombinase n=1 Tax=Halomicronema hongdechloris C2206 TaxID=1641165 RepID=A0A1Z3HKX1_9CYAN|nr:phage integrase N-terminal SAM-like domain-containing protein [Halomicronema hongdechloris]ASC70906.1 Integrase/recombinase [Halomicronema hongdechloris C2206]
MDPQPRKLLDQVRDAIRLKHYSYKTEQTYVGWIHRYTLFHNKQHPKEMGSAEIEAFLTHLTVEKQVLASTQNQAFSALLFLYRQVLNQDLGSSINAVRARPSRYLPTVLIKAEVRSILSRVTKSPSLVIQILYGSGLRLNEGLRLRVKDLDFAQRHVIVRDAKGNESRSGLNSHECNRQSSLISRASRSRLQPVTIDTLAVTTDTLAVTTDTWRLTSEMASRLTDVNLIGDG